MPNFIAVSEQDVAEIAQEGGNKEMTVRRRNQAMNHLRQFGRGKETPVEVDDLIDTALNGEVGPLEKLLELFFTAFRVGLGENQKKPKKNTADMYR